MFGYKPLQLITAVLVSATAFVLASTLITSGLGAAAIAMGTTGAIASTGIQIFAFAGGILGSMFGFQGGLQLHEKMEEMHFSMTHKRKHTPNKKRSTNPRNKTKSKTWGQKLSTIFKASKASNDNIGFKVEPKKKNDHKPRR